MATCNDDVLHARLTPELVSGFTAPLIWHSQASEAKVGEGRGQCRSGLEG